MSTSVSASKIPNKKIQKKSRKSDLLEDHLLVPVEQEVILPREAQSVQLDSERSVPAEPVTELSSSSEVNGATSNNASSSELGNSGSLLLAQNGSKENLGQLLSPFKSSLWTDLAEILNADTSSSGSGAEGLWGNQLGDSSKDVLLAQNTSKEDISTSSAGSGSAGVDVSTSTMAMVLGGLALLGAAAGGGGGGGGSSSSTSTSSTSSSSSSTTPVSAATSSGSLTDGYIANALVFRDVDNDAVWDHEVFVDNNNNGIYDTGDTFTDTNGDGLFTAGLRYYELIWSVYRPLRYR